MANSVDPDEMAHDKPSSGSTLFAKVSMLVSRDGRVNYFWCQISDYGIFVQIPASILSSRDVKMLLSVFIRDKKKGNKCS